MKHDTYALTTRYEYMATNFLKHILSTSPELLDDIDRLIQRCNRTRLASDQAIHDTLRDEPHTAVGSRGRSGYPDYLCFGGVKGEHGDKEQYNLNLQVSFGFRLEGYIRLDTDDSTWDHFVPKWIGDYRNLESLQDKLDGTIPDEFVLSYDSQAHKFHQALRDLHTFLQESQNAGLTAEHLLFLLPNIQVLFPRGKYTQDSFKRRPRKIAGVALPSITLKQCLAILTSAKDILGGQS